MQDRTEEAIAARGNAQQALERALLAVDRHEPTVKAWTALDASSARATAEAVDARRPEPLSGLVVGVKDLFDTVDFPTSYGSPIYSDHHPVSDAAAVVLLHRAGATILGKTVLAEFATGRSGATTNPRRATHTPGGSSSGSAAAVAAGMADVALGTQSAGSMIRPASFCGVFGFKPTRGLVPIAGVKLISPSLDTIGWFARDVPTLRSTFSALTSRTCEANVDRPSFHVMRTDQWPFIDPDAADAFERAVAIARDAGAEIIDDGNGSDLDGLTEAAELVMVYELARSFAFEFERHRELLSPQLSERIERGGATLPADYDAVLERVRRLDANSPELFGGAEMLITPASVGTAPEGLSSTGDPRFNSRWTLLGSPAVSVPGLVGSNGLPIGIQLVGRRGSDAAVLNAAQWLANCIGSDVVAPI